MHAKMIEHTLRKIQEIDQKAVAVKTETKELEYAKRKELKKRLKEIEFQHMKQARKTAKLKREEILTRADQETQDILERAQQECDQLDKILDAHQEEMVEKVFMRLFELRLRSPVTED